MRDRTGQVRVPKSNKVQYIYQDINLSPVPAGVMASLACSFRNSAMSCETDFVSIAISLCAVARFTGLSVYEFTQRYGYNYDDEKTR